MLYCTIMYNGTHDVNVHRRNWDANERRTSTIYIEKAGVLEIHRKGLEFSKKGDLGKYIMILQVHHYTQKQFRFYISNTYNRIYLIRQFIQQIDTVYIITLICKSFDIL